MVDLRQELLAEARQGMRTSEGAESLQEGEIEDVANVIVAAITGGAWAAMDEWGTGSKMDPSNPALADYLASNAWNPARSDFTIVTRPNMPGQVDIFGKPLNGKGSGGVDLEAIGKVTPQPPSHAIQTALRWMSLGRMQRAVKSVVASFPFGKFIVITKK
ncbi:MAG: hypothetical protein N2376_07400 [Clostridia bacterium]|nr:hypothetical protein [Clostridia bacterium]